MATIQKFEDLLCWQKARELTREVYKNLNISKFQGQQYRRTVRRGMSDTNKMILENQPDLHEYYNSEKDEIEFWRYHQDKDKQKDGI